MFQFAVQQGPTNELWHASNGLDCNALIQVDPTRWAHFAVTWDAQAAKLYKDGALVRTCNGIDEVRGRLPPEVSVVSRPNFYDSHDVPDCSLIDS